VVSSDTGKAEGRVSLCNVGCWERSLGFDGSPISLQMLRKSVQKVLFMSVHRPIKKLELIVSVSHRIPRCPVSEHRANAFKQQRTSDYRSSCCSFMNSPACSCPFLPQVRDSRPLRPIRRRGLRCHVSSSQHSPNASLLESTGLALLTA